MTIQHARGGRSNRSQGFSLIEAMIAFLIIGVGFLGISKLQLFVSAGSGSSQQRTQALHMAQDKIECFRAWPSSCAANYASITAGTDAAITHNGAVFSRAWTVSTFTNPNYRTLEVTVAWENKEGTGTSDPSRQVRLLTKISDVPSVAAASGGSTTSGSATSTTSTTTTVSTTTTTAAPTTTVPTTTAAPTTTTTTTTTAAPTTTTTTTTAAPTTTTTTTTTQGSCLPKNAYCTSNAQCCDKDCQSSSGKCK